MAPLTQPNALRVATRSSARIQAAASKTAIKRKAMDADPATAPASKRQKSATTGKTTDTKSTNNSNKSANAAPKAKSSTQPKAPQTNNARKRKNTSGSDTDGTRKVAKTSSTKATAKATSAAKLVKEKSAAATRGWATRRKNLADAKASEAPKPAAPAKPIKPAKVLPVINHAPTTVLDIWVVGEGGSGELGLGTKLNAVNVKRPRHHHLLSAADIPIVQIAVGGMHCAALTKDGKVYTWGVNDEGALGRGITAESDKYVDIDQTGIEDESNPEDTANVKVKIEVEEKNEVEKESEVSDEDDDNGLNAKEASPMVLPDGSFPEGTVITQLAAGDSITLALTAEGFVYGWGCFRNNAGPFGFSPELREMQFHPVLIKGLEKIVQVACGDNHCLALNSEGRIFSWGAYEQNQLGRRVVERQQLQALKPTSIGLHRAKAVSIATGCYHSFAIDTAGRVHAWGANNSCQTGIAAGAGEDNATIQPPQVVTALAGRTIASIIGGTKHSVARDANGDVLVWGEAITGQLGIDLAPARAAGAAMLKADGNVAIVTVPQVVPGLVAAFATCGTEHNIALTRDGRIYTWGSSLNHQTGVGADVDMVLRPTLVDNTAVRGRKVTWAGAGGQFSVFAAGAAGAAGPADGAGSAGVTEPVNLD